MLGIEKHQIGKSRHSVPLVQTRNIESVTWQFETKIIHHMGTWAPPSSLFLFKLSAPFAFSNFLWTPHLLPKARTFLNPCAPHIYLIYLSSLLRSLSPLSLTHSLCGSHGSQVSSLIRSNVHCSGVHRRSTNSGRRSCEFSFIVGGDHRNSSCCFSFQI